MRYMQIKGGQKLHLVHEIDNELSAPICGRGFRGGERYMSGYRMTINLPWSLGMACKKCSHIYDKEQYQQAKSTVDEKRRKLEEENGVIRTRP